MLVLVIVLTAVAAISFLIALVFFIIFLASLLSKDPDKKKRKLKSFAVAGIIFLLIIGLDITLIVVNRAEIFNTAVEKTAELTANGLGTTAANLGKYYDKNVIKRFGYLDISVSSHTVETEGDENIYTVDLVFDNNAPANEKLYMHILLDNNYLVGADSEDFVYQIDIDDWDEDVIPHGKTKHVAVIALPKDQELAYLLYIGNKLPL